MAWPGDIHSEHPEDARRQTFRFKLGTGSSAPRRKHNNSAENFQACACIFDIFKRVHCPLGYDGMDINKRRLLVACLVGIIAVAFTCAAVILVQRQRQTTLLLGMAMLLSPKPRKEDKRLYRARKRFFSLRSPTGKPLDEVSSGKP